MKTNSRTVNADDGALEHLIAGDRLPFHDFPLHHLCVSTTVAFWKDVHYHHLLREGELNRHVLEQEACLCWTCSLELCATFIRNNDHSLTVLMHCSGNEIGVGLKCLQRKL